MSEATSISFPIQRKTFFLESATTTYLNQYYQDDDVVKKIHNIEVAIGYTKLDQTLQIQKSDLLTPRVCSIALCALSVILLAAVITLFVFCPVSALIGGLLLGLGTPAGGALFLGSLYFIFNAFTYGNVSAINEEIQKNQEGLRESLTKNDINESKEALAQIISLLESAKEDSDEKANAGILADLKRLQAESEKADLPTVPVDAGLDELSASQFSSSNFGEQTIPSQLKL